MLRNIIIAACLFAAPASAQEALSGPEFDALTIGKTFHFSVEGEVYGGEAYLPGHVIDWSYLDGDCKRGSWYAEAGNICFVYEDGLQSQCWTFFRQGDGLRARLATNEADARPYSAEIAQNPLYCRGPEVGV